MTLFFRFWSISATYSLPMSERVKVHRAMHHKSMMWITFLLFLARGELFIVRGEDYGKFLCLSPFQAVN